MIPPLHAVTDDEILGAPDVLRTARELIRAGGASLAFHLRGPGTGGARHFELARELRLLARESGSQLLVNDRVDVALAADLDGVHLGQRSLPPGEAREILGPDAVVGVSVHDRDEAVRAAEGGADYLVVGTIYATPSHPGAVPTGPGLLEELSRELAVPLIAIGGMSPERVAGVKAAGAAGVAAVGALWKEEGAGNDPAGAVREFLDALGAPAPVRGNE